MTDHNSFIQFFFCIEHRAYKSLQFSYKWSLTSGTQGGSDVRHRGAKNMGSSGLQHMSLGFGCESCANHLLCAGKEYGQYLEFVQCLARKAPMEEDPCQNSLHGDFDLHMSTLDLAALSHLHQELEESETNTKISQVFTGSISKAKYCRCVLLIDCHTTTLWQYNPFACKSG
ncbi:hypothetical protein O6H91_10G011100 [Diphasiastrum complanatum]|uniref:Uncharacterized protein n=2 Tax=Diphasiastrum complanatum TaxID=34168 RepID=A0ACC2CEA6_DIPCM|nr:hypothetical protein O6H91_18G007600 [Diphasiastrum complanatum]KAJ7540371.1 hypothetical protein O6H91_10G011100 [Diphasiastrum complanatum]